MGAIANSTNRRTSRLWLAFGGLLVAVLLGGVFTLGSLNVPFAPDTRTEFIVLFALSTFNIVALFIFGLILIRSLFRLWAEHRSDQLGGRFKTKMVLGAMGISLLPLIFMFFISYALMNRTLNKWFSRPLEIAVELGQQMLQETETWEGQRLASIAGEAMSGGLRDQHSVHRAIEKGADAAWYFAPTRGMTAGAEVEPGPEIGRRGQYAIATTKGLLLRKLKSGLELWKGDFGHYLGLRLTLREFEHPIVLRDQPVSRRSERDRRVEPGTIIVGRRLSPDLYRKYEEISAQLKAYAAQGQELRTFKNQILLTLALFTVLLMFSAMWFALFLSKQVTGPIQALAQGTQEVSRGNFAYQVDAQARDELGVLVSSFNQMTRQLGDSRRQLDEFTRTLQQAVTEIEERRKEMEAILENIPTAVLSLDPQGGITRSNQAATRIFGDGARARRTLAELLGPEAAGVLEPQMRKALRMGAASAEIEISLPAGNSTSERRMQAAVTVSALGTRRQNPGFVMVIDDLTELLRAQKAAAWQEVAQRIAHEIKNPLTPIQLSAQRLMRYLDRSTGAQATAREPELAALIGECAGLIEREVATLKSLVDEFSQFARFPAPKLLPCDAQGIVSGAMEVFTGRLDGVTVRTEFDEKLPAIKADAELLRRALVNLIDNAAEAMEGSPVRELHIATRLSDDGDWIELVVADSGHGISPADREKLFLPHFSTRNRGTGLGLAIAGRIVAEHGGTIRVEDNHPVGARFIVRLPAAAALVPEVK
jgi:PAS domain S-box-containing protein